MRFGEDGSISICAGGEVFELLSPYFQVGFGEAVNFTGAVWSNG